MRRAPAEPAFPIGAATPATTWHVQEFRLALQWNENAAAASIAVAKVMQVRYPFNPGIDAVSFAFSAVIGVVFGCFPARRAARLDPIDALRHE